MHTAQLAMWAWTAAHPLVIRVRSRLTLWGLWLSGQTLNLAEQFKTVWRQRRLQASLGNALRRILGALHLDRSDLDRFKLARRPTTGQVGYATRQPTIKDLDALRAMRKDLQALIAQLEMQHIAGTDKMASQPRFLSQPAAPFSIAEMRGQTVGLIATRSTPVVSDAARAPHGARAARNADAA